MSKLSRRSYDYSFSEARNIPVILSTAMAGGFSMFLSFIKFPVLSGYAGIQSKTPQPRTPHGCSHPMFLHAGTGKRLPGAHLVGINSGLPILLSI